MGASDLLLMMLKSLWRINLHGGLGQEAAKPGKEDTMLYEAKARDRIQLFVGMLHGICPYRLTDNLRSTQGEKFE